MTGTGHLPQDEPQEYFHLRQAMVSQQVEARGIKHPLVLRAMRAVPRQEFVPREQRWDAYQDAALPIGHGLTISQPFIVGLMSELIAPAPGQKILEIGTGSGYQAALLAEIGASVYSLEIIEPQAQRAEETLSRLGYSPRVQVIRADGAGGWPAAAPYDAVLVTCAVSSIPEPWSAQLRPGGRMVLPLGENLGYQTLTLVEKSPAGGLSSRGITGVVFVPMTGPRGFQAED